MPREDKVAAAGLPYTEVKDEKIFIVLKDGTSINGTYSVDLASCGIFNFSVSGDLQKLGKEFEDQITSFLGYFSSAYNRSSSIEKIGFVINDSDVPELRYQGQHFPGHGKSNKHLYGQDC